MFEDSYLDNCAFIEEQSRWEEMQFFNSVNDFLDIIDMGKLDEMMSFIKTTYPEMYQQIVASIKEQ